MDEMTQLLKGKTIKVRHCINIMNRPMELMTDTTVYIYDVREHDSEYVMVNGGWLVPITDINTMVLEGGNGN